MLAVGLAAAVCARPQSSGASFAEVRQKLVKALAESPKYTCTETLDQWRRRRGGAQFEPVERFRLDVANIGGRELFSWPAGGTMNEQDVSEMVGGMAGNGDFSAFLDSLLSINAEFTTGAEDQRDGHLALRFGYRVSRKESPWSLKVGPSQTTVGYHGSIWIDQQTPGNLEVTADAEDTRSLGFKSVTRVQRYEAIRIGDSDAIVPISAELRATERNGSETRTTIQFGGCRQYSVTSTIQFSPQDPKSRPEPETPADQALKLPNGTKLYGRITRLPLIDGHRYLDLEFLSFDLNGTSVDISRRKNEVTVIDERLPVAATAGPSGWPTPIPGARRLRVPAGLRLRLRSVSVAP